MRLTVRLSLLALAVAAALPAAAETKIGIVDANRVLAECDQGKAAQAAFKKEVEERQKQVTGLETELTRLKGEFDKQSGVMTESAKRERQAELDKKWEEYQRQTQQLTQELNEIRARLLAPIGDRVKAVIHDVAQAEGLQLVIDVAAGVAYADDSLDVTNQVIRRYNVKYPATGAAPAAAAAPAKKAPEAKPAAGGKK